MIEAQFEIVEKGDKGRDDGEDRFGYGAFETADDQFDRLRDERSAYAESVKGAIASQARNSLDRQIDLESLSEYLKWRFPDREESPRRDVAELLNELHNLGCRTLKEVDEPVSRAEHALEAFESAYPPTDESTGEGGPYAPVGAVRVALSFVRIADGGLGARSGEKV